MTSYSRSTVTDQVLLRDLASHLSENRASTATLLADLGEVEERKLYVPAAYPSMHLYCVHELHMSEETAWKRLRAARAARQFPAIFPALADGRVHLTAIVLLAPHLTADTADELLAAATHRSKSEIERLLAERFPKLDVRTTLQPISPAGATEEQSLLTVDAPAHQLSPGTVVPSVEPNFAMAVGPLPSRSKLAPLSRGRFALQVTLDQETHDQLRHAQTLLGHVLPSGDVAQVLKRALNALVRELEKRKFAKCDRPRPQKGVAKGRHIPAAVKRAVRERDGGQCTFVSDAGIRCEARGALEFDHVEAFARGGESTTDNLRLRCRVHNQFEAESTFSAEFMRGKREGACEMAAQRRAERAEAEARAKAKAEAQARADAEAKAREEFAREQDVIPWLRELKFSLADARKGAAACAHIPDAPIEQRMKIALRALAPHCVRIPAPSASSPA